LESVIEYVVLARKPARVATERNTETVTANTDGRVKASRYARGLITFKNRNAFCGIMDSDAPREDGEPAPRIMLSNGDPIDEKRAIFQFLPLLVFSK